MKGHPEVRKRLEAEQISALRLSAIVLGELEFGAEKSAYGERNRARLAALTQRALAGGASGVVEVPARPVDSPARSTAS